MENTLAQKSAWLDKNIFFGLQDINDGFDAADIKYFSQNDFAEVLNRIKKHGAGVLGIEPWKEGEFYSVMVYEDFTNDATDPIWYMKAFESFKAGEAGLQYAATYYVPPELLQ